MFSLSVYSFTGECRKLAVAGDTTLEQVRAQLEKGLPRFHEMRLFQGERELADGDAVEVTLNMVATPSPTDKVLAVLESAGQAWMCDRPADLALAAAEHLAVTPAELSALECERLLKLVLYNFVDGAAFHYKLFEALGVALGRWCADPARIVEHMLDRRVTEVNNFYQNSAFLLAFAEISARSECHLREHGRSAELIACVSDFSQEIIACVRMRAEHEIQFIDWVSNRECVLTSAFRLLGHLGDSSHEDILQEWIHLFPGLDALSFVRKEAEAARLLISERAEQMWRSKEVVSDQVAPHASEPHQISDMAARIEAGSEGAGPEASLAAEVAREELVEALRQSEQDALEQEQADTNEAVLRSKAEVQCEVTVLGLAFTNQEVVDHLLAAEGLQTCVARVREAGGEVRPAWAHGALVLVPISEEDLEPHQIVLKAHHIVLPTSKLDVVKTSLGALPRRRRPLLRAVEEMAVTHGLDSSDENGATFGSSTASPRSTLSSEEVLELTVERTFLHYPFPKDVSEASAMAHSAPATADTAVSANPRRWKVPK